LQIFLGVLRNAPYLGGKANEPQGDVIMTAQSASLAGLDLRAEIDRLRK